MDARPNVVPIPLRTKLPASELVDRSPCDGVVALGSYWTHPGDLDLQSTLVRHFKSRSTTPMELPGMREITHAYASMLIASMKDWNPTAVLRVLASGETRPDLCRPHGLLIDLVAGGLGVPDVTDLFFRTEPRKPMRMIESFSGPDVLRRRINYVLQDIVIIPRHVGGRVVLIDDIYNLGATARVYSAALKQFCGVDEVRSSNIAAARFSGGKDGWGRLSLDLDAFLTLARCYSSAEATTVLFGDAWIEKNSDTFHTQSNCLGIESRAHRSIRLFAASGRVPCPSCTAAPDPRGAIRRWMMRLRSGE